MEDFQADYRLMLRVLQNQKPSRLPLYEHIISPRVMEEGLGVRFADLIEGSPADQDEFFRYFCDFFRRMTFDAVSFEVCITEILPDGGAIMGGKRGPIQSRADLERYPWKELPGRFWHRAGPRFDALIHHLPPGMKAVGGVGNGVFEIAQDLVGFEYLCYLLADDPILVSDLFRRIGGLMMRLWKSFLERYAGAFAICRFGDDLGYKTATMLPPDVIRRLVIPQYRRLIGQIHAHDRPFLFHCCGNIFAVMEDLLAAGIDGKHSNEDAIAPFTEWIRLYGGRIALLGGIDVNILFSHQPDEIYRLVCELGAQFMNQANGYALGSGNSIPEFIPFERFYAMVRAAQFLRGQKS